MKFSKSVFLLTLTLTFIGSTMPLHAAAPGDEVQEPAQTLSSDQLFKLVTAGPDQAVGMIFGVATEGCTWWNTTCDTQTEIDCYCNCRAGGGTVVVCTSACCPN